MYLIGCILKNDGNEDLKINNQKAGQCDINDNNLFNYGVIDSNHKGDIKK